MIFRQIVRNETGCASYLLGCPRSGEAIVIDPLADLGARMYALEAADRGLRIVYVIDTHIHADHRSAAQELAHVTGATLALPEGALVEYQFHPLRDGDTIAAGAVQLTVIHTPGHTPESACLLVTDTTRAREPWFLLSGDTLFPGDVGRPDLLLDGADASQRTLAQAGQLYASLFDRLLALDDIVEIYPGHFGGSACGGLHMSGKPVSTIGFERRWNLALQKRDLQGFVGFVLESLRPQPENYQAIKRVNQSEWRPGQVARSQSGARQSSAAPQLAWLSASTALAAIGEGSALVDLRPAPDFAAAHAPAAISMPFSRADLAPNLALLLASDQPVVLVGDNDLVAAEAASLLQEAGWAVRGVLAGGMASWWNAGQGVAMLELWPIERLHDRYADPDLAVVDVREPQEWAAGVIAGARLIPQAQLRDQFAKLPRDRQIVTICAGGVRSARAASLLSHLGMPHVATLDRVGMLEWLKRGYEVVSASG